MTGVFLAGLPPLTATQILPLLVVAPDALLRSVPSLAEVTYIKSSDPVRQSRGMLPVFCRQANSLYKASIWVIAGHSRSAPHCAFHKFPSASVTAPSGFSPSADKSANKLLAVQLADLCGSISTCITLLRRITIVTDAAIWRKAGCVGDGYRG